MFNRLVRFRITSFSANGCQRQLYVRDCDVYVMTYSLTLIVRKKYLREVGEKLSSSHNITFLTLHSGCGYKTEMHWLQISYFSFVFLHSTQKQGKTCIYRAAILVNVEVEIFNFFDIMKISLPSMGHDLDRFRLVQPGIGMK